MDANSFQTRGGQSGSWRDELAAEISERLIPEDQELMQRLGYTA